MDTQRKPGSACRRQLPALSASHACCPSRIELSHQLSAAAAAAAACFSCTPAACLPCCLSTFSFNFSCMHCCTVSCTAAHVCCCCQHVCCHALCYHAPCQPKSPQMNTTTCSMHVTPACLLFHVLPHACHVTHAHRSLSHGTHTCCIQRQIGEGHRWFACHAAVLSLTCHATCHKAVSLLLPPCNACHVSCLFLFCCCVLEVMEQSPLPPDESSFLRQRRATG